MTRKKNEAPKSEPPMNDSVGAQDSVHTEVINPPVVDPPKAAQYPSVTNLGLAEHVPERIDLRPYFTLTGETYEHHVSAALVAHFARKGTPLEFTPSPEHLLAIGGTDGINQYGVREAGVKIGEPPTEYDLTADSIRLDVTVFAIDLTGDDRIKPACAALASGHIVRIGDGFLTAFGPDGLVGTNGPIESLDGQEMSVWVVSRP